LGRYALRYKANVADDLACLAQQRHHLFRLGALGKGCEAAQVTEHNDDLAAMAFEDAVVTLGDDQLGELWREETAQFSAALDFGELRRDPRLQLLVPASDLLNTRPQFLKVMARVRLGVTLSDAETRDIVAFLESLTGDLPANFATAPVLPSGAVTPAK
jgi:cytochrome c peroxidase